MKKKRWQQRVVQDTSQLFEASRKNNLKNLVDHEGVPLPRDAYLFVIPPDSLGPVLSAGTTLTTDYQPRLIRTSIIVTLTGCLGALAGLGMAGLANWGETWDWLWPILGGILGLAYGVVRAAFVHQETCVCREGIAIYTCFIFEDWVLWSVLKFRNVVEVRMARAHYYVQQRYRSTYYDYYWCDEEGNRALTIWGRHRGGELNRPPPGDQYYFARAAVDAWNRYAFEEARRQLDDGQSVRFRVERDYWIRLGIDEITFKLDNDDALKFSVEEMDYVHLEEGTLFIVPTSTVQSRLPPPGQLKITLSQLGNGELFLILLKELHGICIK